MTVSIGRSRRLSVEDGVRSATLDSTINWLFDRWRATLALDLDQAVVLPDERLETFTFEVALAMRPTIQHQALRYQEK